jgi:peptidoglycan/LPS O-acetylase OafA/YrhL
MASEHTAGRYRFLDGLRGWAAVVVLFHHTFVDGLPANIVMANRAVWAPVFFLSGGFAVSVFFVISGFSLSIRYLETGDEKGLVRLAAGRYVRLALPIFTICAITYLLLILEVIPPAMQRPSPLNEFVAFEPNLSSLLNFSLINVFVSHSPTDTYDPPLWTMSYEFIGSFMVFSIVAVVRSWRLRSSSLAILFIVLVVCQTYFALFVAGILIADQFLKVDRLKSANLVGATLCAAGLVMPLLLYDPSYTFAATFLTAGVAFFAPIRRLFENRLGGFLGYISFPLYLVQAAVIYSFSLHGLKVLATFGFEQTMQRWLVGSATIPVAILFAVAFCPINDIAVTVSRRLGSTCIILVNHFKGLTSLRPKLPKEL